MGPCIIKSFCNCYFIFYPSYYHSKSGNSNTCQSQFCGGVGKLACLNNTPASLFLQVCVCVSKRDYEGGANCVSGVCLLLHQVCVCFCVSPHSLISVSVAVAACTCAWFRLQLAHTISCLNFADTIPSPSQPTFPTTYFPTVFFFTPACPIACRDFRGREHDSLNTGGKGRRGE